MSRTIDGPPASLKYSIGELDGLSRQLEWEDGKLWFREDPLSCEGLHRRPWKPFVEPSRSHWERLRQALDGAGFWQWPKELLEASPVGDCEWNLAVRWGAHSRRVSGRNAFPPTFDAVEEAVLGLLSQEAAGLPAAFHLRCEWPAGEEHYEWDGRALSYARYLPRLRVVEGLPVPAGTWKRIIPVLEAALLDHEPEPPPAGDFTAAIESPFWTAPQTGRPLQRRSRSPRFMELRKVLWDLVPPDPRG